MGQVGVHGIVIKFTDDRGAGFSATFLPEVAAEQGVQAGIPKWNQFCVDDWLKRFTLLSLLRSARAFPRSHVLRPDSSV